MEEPHERGYSNRIRKLEAKHAPSRTLLVWAWGKSDAEVEAIAARHAGPEDVVIPVTWQRPAEASGRAWGTLGDLNIGERDELRDSIRAELATRAEARAQ